VVTASNAAMADLLPETFRVSGLASLVRRTALTSEGEAHTTETSTAARERDHSTASTIFSENTMTTPGAGAQKTR
jgi:hypothetical protein